MKESYHVIIDAKDGIYNATAKTMKLAKSKVTKFKKSYPWAINTAKVYKNHEEIADLTN